MRKFILFTLFLLISMVGFSQSYIGWINKQVNFREGPGTENSIIKSLKPGTQIFIVSTTAENNYLNIIDIETNKEGYVHKSYIRLGEVVEVAALAGFLASKAAGYITGETIHINGGIYMS